MPAKIRLQRKGRKKQPFYHIVVADARAPRDGKYIERLGSFNPMTEPATILLDADAAFDWLMKGAQPTDTAKSILKQKGVLYKKHLQRGVKKGALTQEQADEKLATWLGEKDASFNALVEKTNEAKAAQLVALSGTPKPLPEPEVEETPEVEAGAEEATEATETPEAEA